MLSWQSVCFPSLRLPNPSLPSWRSLLFSPLIRSAVSRVRRPAGQARAPVRAQALDRPITLRSTRAPQAVHELDHPAVEGARELIAEHGEARHWEPFALDPRLQTLDQPTGLDRPHRW